jgi:beta-lactamase regulating signal transducer with metallopeptidase domain
MSKSGLRAVRDLSRRQLLLLTISSLTLLATIPVVGHHAIGSGATLLEGRDNIGDLCLIALHIILAPVHSGFHLALIVGVLYATADRIRARVSLHRGIARLPLTEPDPHGSFADAIAAAGVDRATVRLVDGLANPAFTAGWWEPRIYLAAELPLILSQGELERVIAHENAHLQRRDPLRLAVLRFFACMLFWIPALRKLAADVADEAEFEADEVAARGQPLILASAILKVALWKQPQWRAVTEVGFVGRDLVEQRVRRLSGERHLRTSHITIRSLIGATAMLAAVLSSGILVAHPLHAASPSAAGHNSEAQSHRVGSGHSGKCVAHDEPVFLHLLCGGLPFGIAGVDCPHHDRPSQPGDA